MKTNPIIRAFFDEPTNTVSYLVADPKTKRAAVIDPVLDYDHRSGKATTKSADAIVAVAAAEAFIVDWVLETHAHADHLSGAPYIKLKTGAKVGIGELSGGAKISASFQCYRPQGRRQRVRPPLPTASGTTRDS
jgi:glyoxylase-like metal-dependent hydrolase (beta-lactamase superfamily II)